MQLPIILTSLGNVEMQLLRFDCARDHLEEARTYYDSHNNVPRLAEVNKLLGKRRGFIMTGRGFTNLQEAYLTALGIFSEDISLEAMKPEELYQIALNSLNLVRETPKNSPEPFTPEILNQIVNYAHGSPRQLNLICYDVLKQGIAFGCEKIDAETFPKIWQTVQKKLDFLTPHLRRLMSIIHQAGGIDEDISDRHLDDLGILTFVELLPDLKNLEQEELLIRVEDESGLRFIPSQLFVPPES